MAHVIVIKEKWAVWVALFGALISDEEWTAIIFLEEAISVLRDYSFQLFLQKVLISTIVHQVSYHAMIPPLINRLSAM
jgi:hypothetical protein